jgi:Spy/CpxP family protein refolding chaperone
MKNRSIIFGVAALLVVGLAVPFAYAQHMRARGMAMRPGADFAGTMMLGHLARAQEQLGLSDQQVSDIKAIFKGLHEQNAAYRDQLRGNMKSIADALIADPNNVSAAQAILARQEAAEHAMKVNALNAAAKALNVLTPDQRTKLAQHLQDRAERFQHMR